MKTQIENFQNPYYTNKERMGKSLKEKEKGFIIRTTQEKLNDLTNNTHLQLELELAEIFWLNSKKVANLIESHKEKPQLTIAKVMDDMERILNFDQSKNKQFTIA